MQFIFIDPKRVISIHALREESDGSAARLSISAAGFLSTLSVRRATPRRGATACRLLISIHALREESDHILLK